LSRVARSTDTRLESTRLRVTLPQDETFRTLVLGPMNVTSGFRYRVQRYAGAGFSTVGYDSGWTKPFEGSAGGALSLEWENANFWLGIIPFDDDERGVYLIHQLPTDQTGQYWSFEIDDQNNPAGFVQIGRLFMPETWSPSINYGYGENGLSFKDNSLRASTLSGSTEVWRRINPRVWRGAFPYLPESEGFAEAYRFFRAAGYDGEVFIVPDPDEPSSLQQRSFMGTLTQMDPLSQASYGLVGTGFSIEEII